MSSEPRAAARSAGLRYVNAGEAGITRRGTKRFSYVDEDGKQVKDDATLARIKKLAIPPAWTDVWICRSDNGHLQATGRDVRGRTQYRYHERWREVRDEAKYGRMLAFAEALPRVRARVRRDLKLKGLARERVLATLVRLLDETAVRVGNEEYAEENGSFGLTTLRNRHAHVRGGTVKLRFKGKSGVMQEAEVEDARVAKIVRACLELPGQDLFQYEDEEGACHPIASDDLNAYLKEISGGDFTAKDFRTWRGTLVAAAALAACEGDPTKVAVKDAIAHAADALGNTVAVCRKSYVHPALADMFLKGEFAKRFAPARGGSGLRADERKLLGLLRKAH